MMLITCPWCGRRAQTEFSYIDDATARRPNMDSVNEAEHFKFVYECDSRRGVQYELWHHHAGCGKFFKIHRDTITHEIHATSKLSNGFLEGVK